MKDGLKTTCSGIEKLCESVKYIKLTPSRKQAFREIIEISNIETNAWPSTDVPTRWNSTYQMIKSSLPYISAYSTLRIQDSNYHHCPSDDEWEQLKTMSEFLSVFNTGESEFSIVLFI